LSDINNPRDSSSSRSAVPPCGIRMTAIGSFSATWWRFGSGSVCCSGAPTAADPRRPRHMASLSQSRIHNSALLSPCSPLPQWGRGQEKLGPTLPSPLWGRRAGGEGVKSLNSAELNNLSAPPVFRPTEFGLVWLRSFCRSFVFYNIMASFVKFRHSFFAACSGLGLSRLAGKRSSS
jgi:hypothetical protein